MFILGVLVQHKIYSLDKEFVYFCNVEISRGCRVKINFHNQEIIGFVNNVEFFNGNANDYQNEFGIKIKEVNEIVDYEPIINEELFKLAQQLSDYYIYPLIGVLQTMLPSSLTPNKSTINAPKIKYNNFYELSKHFDMSGLSTNEQKVIKKFDGRPLIKTSELNKTKALTNLINKKVIQIKKEEVSRYQAYKTFNYEENISLTDEQQIVFDEAINSKENTFLLKGVTGSGKTEVYIKLIEHYLSMEKTTILLVPEIALTPLMISRILGYFKNGVAVLHSSLTSAQKYDEYRKINNGNARIVIGTRSAIFAPIKKLGLIIIDEENDESYKQDDQFLLYNAKEVALIRAKNVGAKVIFGTATPSIEMMAKANAGQIKLLCLNKRYNNASLPNVSIVDKTDYKMFSLKNKIFSYPMIEKINLALFKKQKVILFVNSRGYSNYLTCRECGYTFKCPKCGLPLHYHKNDNILFCHHCDYKIKKPLKCPDCNSSFFSFGSFGIEKVEEEFKNIFNVPYLVLDSDRASTGTQIERILSQFNSDSINVLIGTQLVAKGHDFKNVGFVGILNADSLLNYPNYRSREITFNLLTQVIGRAGRKDIKGNAIIQTSKINDYAILYAAKQDYDEFYNKELINRKALNNPPFVSICALDIKSKKRDYVQTMSKSIYKFLKSNNMESTIILGPSLIRYINNKYVTQIFIKYKKLSTIKETIKMLTTIYCSKQEIELRINFNPYSF